MRIAYDIRPLLTRNPSGVSYFCHSVLTRLAVMAPDLVQCGNAWHTFESALPLPSQTAQAFTRFPNRIFNASIRAVGLPRVEQTLRTPFVSTNVSCAADVLFLPNVDFVSTRLPFVLTVHDLSFVHFPEFFSVKTRAWHRAVGFSSLVRRATRIVAVSESTKADVVETLGIPEERVTVAQLAPTFSVVPDAHAIASIRARYALPERFVLFLGTVETRKNVEGLIEAFAQACGAGSALAQAHLVIAGGPGFGFSQIQNAAARSGVAARIRFLGYLPDADRPALIAAASVFAYVSFAEGFGLPPLEAMSLGVPVVVSDIPSHRELFEGAGLLANPCDTSEIALALQAFLCDETFARDYSARGQERSQRFHWEHTARQVHGALRLAAGRE